MNSHSPSINAQKCQWRYELSCMYLPHTAASALASPHLRHFSIWIQQSVLTARASQTVSDQHMLIWPRSTMQSCLLCDCSALFIFIWPLCDTWLINPVMQVRRWSLQKTSFRKVSYESGLLNPAIVCYSQFLVDSIMRCKLWLPVIALDSVLFLCFMFTLILTLLLSIQNVCSFSASEKVGRENNAPATELDHLVFSVSGVTSLLAFEH